MQLNNSEEIYKKVKEGTGKSDQELEETLSRIKEKYQGLLSDVGAKIMLAKQLGVDLDMKSTSSVLKISELTSSQDGVSLYARVKFIPPQRTFKSKDGSTGKLQAVFIQDDTGSTKLSLWQEKADIVNELKLDKNDLIFIKDAFATTYKERLELSLRHGGSITKNPENAPQIEKVEDTFLDVSDIEEASEKPISTIGRIINIYPINTFEKDGESKKVLNFEISDGIKNIKCVAWEPWAQEIFNNFSKGNIIKLSDVRVKDGLYDLELYINWNSTVISNPKTDKKIPELSDIISASQEVEEGKVSDLEDGKNYKIDGLIVSIVRNKLRYFKCPNCNEKVQIINEEFICEKCNEVVEPVINLFASIEIDDGTGILKVVFFKEMVEKIFNLKTEDLGKEITEERKNEIFEKLDDSLLGKKVSVTGKSKLNNFSSQIELLANSIEIIE